MKLKYWLLALSLVVSGISSAQLNDYKYIIVPKRFEVFKNVNQHNTSVLVKYLLNEEGFNVVYDDAQPLELRTDPCLGLRTVLNNNSSLLATKVVIDLVDCQGELVFTTQEGRSKEKDYKEAYAEAIQEAMWSLKGLDYSYRPGQKSNPVEPATPVQEVASEPEVTPASQQVPAPEAEVVVSAVAEERESPEVAEEVWYAQELATGFQLVDSTPRIRMKLFTTSLEEVFIAEKEGTPGLVYNKGGSWWYEYYENGTKRKEQLNIRF